MAKTPGFPIFLANAPPITLLLSSSFLPVPRLLSPRHVTSNRLGHPLWLNTKISNVNTSKGYIFPGPNTEPTTLLLFPFLSPPTSNGQTNGNNNIPPTRRSALQFLQHPLLTECTRDVWDRCTRCLARCAPPANLYAWADVCLCL